ncbi:MAG: hypothetical protein H7315_16530 [Herminiimonas sp.]|nr:hypothetical protein [Herminiimonas sp.]
MLLRLQQQWLFFDTALSDPTGLANKPMLSASVAMSSERILAVMDRITGMYQALS